MLGEKYGTIMYTIIFDPSEGGSYKFRVNSFSFYRQLSSGVRKQQFSQRQLNSQETKQLSLSVELESVRKQLVITCFSGVRTKDFLCFVEVYRKKETALHDFILPQHIEKIMYKQF